MENQEVYIVSTNGSLTIIDAEYAEHAIRQLRSGRRKIKVFRDRAAYLEYQAQMERESREQKRIMMEEKCFNNDNHRSNS